MSSQNTLQANTTGIAITGNLKQSKKAWLVVGLLCIVGALNYLDRIVITTMRTSVIDAIPMTDAQFGLLTSVFLWVYGFLSPFAGYLADRFNRSRVIIVSLFIWSAVTWLTSYATTFEELLATRALMGLSEACYIPAALALIADYHKGPTLSLATGIHMAGVMAGQSLGFVGGWIAEEHDWTYTFSIFGIVGIVYSIVLAMILRDAPRTEKVENADENKLSFTEGVKALFRIRSFNLMVIFWGVVSIVTWIIAGWLPTYYKEEFNLSQSLAGLYATGYLYPVSIGGLLLGGFIADRWSKRTRKARILVPAIGLCIAAPALLLASSTGLVLVAVICFMMYALTKAFTDANTMPILCLVADPRYRATAYGILNFLGCLLGGVGLYLSGVLRDNNINLNTVYQFAALLVVIGAGILFIVKPKYKLPAN
jgi:MFS family permease